MKKRIFTLLLALSLLLSLAACAAEKHDLLYETTVDSITYCVRGSGTRAKQLVLKSGDEILFKTDVKVTDKVGSMEGTYGFEAVDLNFDGNLDFMIADDVAGECISYLCWLWSPAEGTYKKSEELSGLCNIYADPDLKALKTFLHTYETEDATSDSPSTYTTTDSTTLYEWKNGKLTPSMRASIIYDSEVELYRYSLYYYDPDTGTLGGENDSYDRWFTPEEYEQEYLETNQMSFLYYFRKTTD